jgi:hypothetical protein
MKKLILVLMLVLGTLSFATELETEKTGVRFNVLFWTVGGTLDGQLDAGEDLKNKDYNGVDLNLLSLSKSGNFTGYQFSFFGMNKVNKDFKGLGQATINYHKGHSTGAQVGMVNIAKDIKGAQWGLVNTTKNLDGFQIGLINHAPNGFLPFFPFFNFSKDLVE